MILSNEPGYYKKNNFGINTGVSSKSISALFSFSIVSLMYLISFWIVFLETLTSNLVVTTSIKFSNVKDPVLLEKHSSRIVIRFWKFFYIQSSYLA